MSTKFALSLLVCCSLLTAASGYCFASSPTIFAEERFDLELDTNHNGIEDILDSWLQGQSNWDDLRIVARPLRGNKSNEDPNFNGGVAPRGGPWQDGQLRLICLGAMAADLSQATAAGRAMGQVRILHDLHSFGGITVFACDSPGLEAFLEAQPAGRIMLDRDGTPALDESRITTGQSIVARGPWPLGTDWSGTVAILDSGCDTAHNDLGDPTGDNIDGPAPEVGDASDWFDAANGWPLSSSFKVMGWQDVTNDFPLAAGPWDYHHHGTALASVVVGQGLVDDRYAGMAPAGRLTVVKFYDFDEVWHSWAGDFIAACAWTLENRDIYRIRTVLVAVNWDIDAGISNALDAFVEAGILPVVAMGNDGPDSSAPGYPAALPGVLTVGSMDRTGAVAYHSGRGVEGQDKPDLLAPGGGQPYDSWIHAADNEPVDSYSGRQGTSMAAAHVAGAAFLLQEAFLDRGMPASDSRENVLDQMAIMKATTSRISSLENISGDSWDLLPVSELPTPSRGWGGLRVDAAVASFSRSLVAGATLVDTLSFDNSRPVSACKLNLGAGIRYVVEAIADPGLDVSLDIVNTRWLDSPSTLGLVQRHNLHGSGSSESAIINGEQEAWFLAVVKRVSGEGNVILRLREDDSFQASSKVMPLPGMATAAPCFAFGPNADELLVVAASRVDIDLGARSLGVYDSDGQWYGEWPVFVFPGPSALGGIKRPLTWNMDGNPGDEIVITSDFGSVYFFTLDGEMQHENYGFNVSLTNPVGLVDASGKKLVAAVDENGVVFLWSWGLILEQEIDLEFDDPLAPCTGQLLPSEGQQIVVSFMDGHIVLLDAMGEIQQGWPVELDVALKVPPILLDLDSDGTHEIIQVHLDEDSGIVRCHIFNGLGEHVAGSPVVVPTPYGGQWVAISDPSVAGSYATGNLRMMFSGVADNGQSGSQDKWHLVNAGLNLDLNTFWHIDTGFEVSATTSEGHLSLEDFLLPAPLNTDQNQGGGGDPVALVALSWIEDLYGLTTIAGAFTGRASEASDGSALVKRRPLDGGPFPEIPTIIAAAHAPLIPGIQLELTVVDDQIFMVTWPFSDDGGAVWLLERGDKLNSGAYPLRDETLESSISHLTMEKLQVSPNPGAGNFTFSWPGDKATGDLKIQIYDLHGRHIRTLISDAADGLARWDGNDRSGHPLGAGVYLAVGKFNQQTAVSRVVLLR